MVTMNQFLDLSVPANAAALLATLAVALLGTTLYLATQRQGTPLEQLGKRTRGRHLHEYLVYYFLPFPGEPVGVTGYDPILGALSPPLRVAVHVSMILLLTVALDQAMPLTVVPAYAVVKETVLWWLLALSVLLYLACMGILHHVLPGVSVPGLAPRKQKILRHAAWLDQEIPFPSNKSKWQFVSAQASHVETEGRFQGTSASLQGEPAGRDVWTTNAKAANNAAPDEALVQELASGGRSLGSGAGSPSKKGGSSPFVFNPAENPNSSDMVFRAQMIRKYLSQGKSPPPRKTDEDETVEASLKRAVHFYSMLQCDDGHWAGDYGGPMFLMPGLIVAWYIMGKPTDFMFGGVTGEDEVSAIDLMKHYIVVHQQVDGGWGTHIESPSTMFGTTMNYVALRLLGMDADDVVCVKGRKFIQDQGGAVMTSSWAKLYLCLLGCMDWKGHNPVPPELWMLPNWCPFHPARMWCHARMVYLPMGYVYGTRYVYQHAETDPIIQSLRQELYCEPYETIPWDKTRHWVAPMDNYSPINPIMKHLHNLLSIYENWSFFRPLRDFLRRPGLAFSLDYMKAEDLQTNCIDIGPVNKVLNMICMYHASGQDVSHPMMMNHLARVADYMWIAEDGMKMKGYNGSQCWDTSFAVQAIYEAGLVDEFPDVSKKVWSYLERCQILSTKTSQSTPAYQFESADNRRKYYRHLSEGGWPFSTSAHGWPISDCTSEGLKGVLCLSKSKVIQEGIQKGTILPISDERLYKSVTVLLTYQNEDGGWPTYENNRGFGWYESLNPSEVFGDIMIDYSYVECSMACLTALADFRHAYPNHRSDEIEHAIDKGRDFLKSVQRADGSWYGSWACCFCYGGWFGVEGLVRCGEPLDSESITKACEFLLRHQRPNGGWGEDFTSCYDKAYAKDGMDAYGDDGSGVVNTAWALLALSAAQCNDVDAVKRGVQYLMRRQLPCGDWPQEGIAGVFNRACGITYTAYRNVFPIWALGRCREVYGSALDE